MADVKSINNIAVVKQDMDAITKELAKVTGYNISQIEQMYGYLLEEQHPTTHQMDYSTSTSLKQMHLRKSTSKKNHGGH